MPDSLLSMVITPAKVHSACLILISISYIIHKAVSHSSLTLEACQRVGINVFMGFIIIPIIATPVIAIDYRVTEVSLQVCTVCHHDIILELLTAIPTLTHYHGTICMYV